MILEVILDEKKVFIKYYDEDQERSASATFNRSTLEYWLLRENITLAKFEANKKELASEFLIKKGIISGKNLG